MSGTGTQLNPIRSASGTIETLSGLAGQRAEWFAVTGVPEGDTYDGSNGGNGGDTIDFSGLAVGALGINARYLIDFSNSQILFYDIDAVVDINDPAPAAGVAPNGVNPGGIDTVADISNIVAPSFGADIRLNVDPAATAAHTNIISFGNWSGTVASQIGGNDYRIYNFSINDTWDELIGKRKPDAQNIENDGLNLQAVSGLGQGNYQSLLSCAWTAEGLKLTVSRLGGSFNALLAGLTQAGLESELGLGAGALAGGAAVVNALLSNGNLILAPSLTAPKAVVADEDAPVFFSGTRSLGIVDVSSQPYEVQVFATQRGGVGAHGGFVLSEAANALLGANLTATVSGNTLTIGGSNASADRINAILANLKWVPAADSAGDATITMTATSPASGNRYVASFDVAVNAVIDSDASVGVGEAHGTDAAPITLKIAAPAVKTGSGEVGHIEILAKAGVPNGATLSDGTNTYTFDATHTGVDISGWDLANLTYTHVAGNYADPQLQVHRWVTQTDPETGDTSRARTDTAVANGVVQATYKRAESWADIAILIAEDRSANPWYYGAVQAENFGGSVRVVYYTSSAGAVDVNLDTGLGRGGNAEGDRYGAGVTTVYGSAHNDRFIGRSGTDDVFNGGAGNDYVEATSGSAGGGDVYAGGSGSDTFDLSRIAGPVSLNLGIRQTGVAGLGPKAAVWQFENVVGTSGNDSFTAQANAANTFHYNRGNSGNDTLIGFDAGTAASHDAIRFTDVLRSVTVVPASASATAAETAAALAGIVKLTASGSNVLVALDKDKNGTNEFQLTVQGAATALDANATDLTYWIQNGLLAAALERASVTASVAETVANDPGGHERLTLNLSGKYEAGDAVRLKVGNSEIEYTVVAGDIGANDAATIGNVRTKVIAAINAYHHSDPANAAQDGMAYLGHAAAGAGGGEILLTVTNASVSSGDGIAFTGNNLTGEDNTQAAAASGGNNANRITFGGTPDGGDLYRVTIGGTQYNAFGGALASNAGKTLGDVVADLASRINADTATHGLTANASGVELTFDKTLNEGSVTYSATKGVGDQSITQMGSFIDEFQIDRFLCSNPNTGSVTFTINYVGIDGVSRSVTTSSLNTSGNLDDYQSTLGSDVLNALRTALPGASGWATGVSNGYNYYTQTSNYNGFEEAITVAVGNLTGVLGVTGITINRTGNTSGAVANDAIRVLSRTDWYTLNGTAEAGDTYSLTVNGSLASYTLVAGDTLAAAAADLASDLDGQLHGLTFVNGGSSTIVAGTAAGNVLKLTLTQNGSTALMNGVYGSGSYVASNIAYTVTGIASTDSASGPTVAATDTAAVELSGSYEAGDKVSVTVNAAMVTYTVAAGDIGANNAVTLANVAAKVAQAINADGTARALLAADAAASGASVNMTAVHPATVAASATNLTGANNTQAAAVVTGLTQSLTPSQTQAGLNAQVDKVVFSALSGAGDKASVTVGGTTYEHTALGAMSAAQVCAALAAQINAANGGVGDAGVIASTNPAEAGALLLTYRMLGAMTQAGAAVTDGDATPDAAPVVSTATAAVTGTAQKNVFTFSGSVTADERYEITIDGATVAYTAVTGDTVSAVKTGLIAAFNAAKAQTDWGAGASLAVDAANGNALTFTGAAADRSYAVDSRILHNASAATAQTWTTTYSGAGSDVVSAGDALVAVVDGRAVKVTADGVKTLATLLGELVTAVNADSVLGASVTAATSGTAFTVTADVAGTPFAYRGGVERTWAMLDGEQIMLSQANVIDRYAYQAGALGGNDAFGATAQAFERGRDAIDLSQVLDVSKSLAQMLSISAVPTAAGQDIVVAVDADGNAATTADNWSITLRGAAVAGDTSLTGAELVRALVADGTLLSGGIA